VCGRSSGRRIRRAALPRRLLLSAAGLPCAPESRE
jgi:hypothetical protein